MAGLASTANLNMLNTMMGVAPDFLWNHTHRVWLSDMGMMLVWSAVYVLAAWSLLLDKPSPRRRHP